MKKFMSRVVAAVAVAGTVAAVFGVGGPLAATLSVVAWVYILS